MNILQFSMVNLSFLVQELIALLFFLTKYTINWYGLRFVIINSCTVFHFLPFRGFTQMVKRALYTSVCAFFTVTICVLWQKIPPSARFNILRFEVSSSFVFPQSSRKSTRAHAQHAARNTNTTTGKRWKRWGVRQ